MIDANLIFQYFPNLTEQQQAQIRQLGPLYQEWNSRINVISRKDMDSFYLHHVLHALALAVEAPFQDGDKVLDVGTGGGFPGIPLAILFPNVQFTLCDSIGKKIKVVEAVSQALGLTNVTPVWSRAEQLPETYDYIVSRAVTELKNFMPFVKGRWSKSILYLKGGDLETEISDCIKTCRLQRKQFECREITRLFPEPFFEEKKIVIIQN
ncbi:MAG: 16S rRNA (guanine(527)-N(7))-methyltransferase RsmG [Bacteroidales bacterium]|nr:16S rRNA (guanine(527)-N(7))-methyltransferase RsmG [Bacteroidales bacterium]